MKAILSSLIFSVVLVGTWARGVPVGVNDPPIDTSYGAKMASKMFKDSINQSVDPCDNFFRFVCDGYNAKHPLGDGVSRIGVNEILQDQVITNLTLALKQVSALKQQEAKSIQAAYNVFSACQRAKGDDYKGAKAILNITKEYGGWPVLDVDPTAWTPARLPKDLAHIVGSIYGVHGVATLLTPNVGIDWKNVGGTNVLYLDQASLATPAVYYTTPNYTDVSKMGLWQQIASTIKALANRTDETGELDLDAVMAQIDAMVQIDYELALISTPDNDNRNSSLQYNPYTVDQAQQEFDAMNWTNFFLGLTAANSSGDEPPVGKFDQRFILVQARSYMPKLNLWLRKYSSDQSKLKDLVNYLIYRLISPYMLFAGPPLQVTSRLPRATKMHKKGYSFGDLPLLQPRLKIKAGSNDVTDQEKNCANFIMAMIPYVAGRLYVDSSFPIDARGDVALMVGNVLAAFKGMLSGLRWMDEQSVLAAFRKIDNMIQNIAYPDFQQDDQQLDQYYDELIRLTKDIDSSQYEAFFAYVKLLVAYQNRDAFRQVLTPGDRYNFLMSPAVVNDWYQPERNSITFPAAQLVTPFYDFTFPKSVNYGAFGATIGHEMTHGFDDEGVQYDYNGTIHTWMTDKSQVGFRNMAQCVVDEYNGFCYPQACLNGVNTQGENIADNGGLIAAYQAYKAWAFSHGEEGRLPDFPDYTPDQIFFIAYGYSWCGQFDDETLTRLLLTNVHSPYPERVNGVVQNFPKFGESFQCKPNSKLYPTNHCDVW